jgi:hypothetical protein
MEGARFYENAWDRVPATRLKPSYGSWAGKGRGVVRVDLTLEPPQLPFGYDEGLYTEDFFARKYARVLAEAPAMNRRIDRVIHALEGKLARRNRNLYNIEVLLSIAHFEKHFLDTVAALDAAEKALLSASRLQQRAKHREVVAELARAHAIVGKNLNERAQMFRRLKAVWEKSRFPKGRSVGGRHYVHVLDDLKDHLADRRVGLDYLLEQALLLHWRYHLHRHRNGECC